jgi:hypothetical protein
MNTNQRTNGTIRTIATRTTIAALTVLLTTGTLIQATSATASPHHTPPSSTHDAGTLTSRSASTNLPRPRGGSETLADALTGPPSTLPDGTAAQPAAPPSTSAHVEDAVLTAVIQTLDTPAAVAYSPASLDLTGRKPSLYRGTFYNPGYEQFRLCIAKRESEHTGSVRGGGGDRYTGFYQFSPELARGAAWMMMDEARTVGLADDVTRLRDTPMNKWPRYFQDWAFWRILDNGNGSQHWAGGRWYCNPSPGAETGW